MLFEMNIQELQSLYAKEPQVGALAHAIENKSVKTIFLEGLVASSVPMVFASLYPVIQSKQEKNFTFLFILGDADEAGYFYHDLTQVLGEERVLFFPSSFRRSVKYAQRDAANEILRTAVLSRLAAADKSLFIVSYPEAVSELVVSRKKLDERTLELHVGEKVDIDFIEETLRTFGFHREDYVYEPGQYAVRGRSVDGFSFRSEEPNGG